MRDQGCPVDAPVLALKPRQQQNPPVSTSHADSTASAQANPWLLDSRQVAGLLGIGRTKAFELMARNQLPVVRIGRCVRVPSKALEAWIAEETARNRRAADRRFEFGRDDR
jgi:excisionase family DNA binding protein